MTKYIPELKKEKSLFDQDLPSSMIFTEWLSEAWLLECTNQQVAERFPTFIDKVSDRTVGELWSIFATRYINYDR